MRILVSTLLRHRPIVLALLAAFVVAGIAAFRDLPVEAYPDVTNIQAQVITLWPGHAAEEVERFITVPVENELNSIAKRAALRSISLFGLSVVTIVFDDDADGFRARSQVAQQLAAVDLPAGAEASVSPDSTPVGEIYRYHLVGPPDMPLVELKAIQDWVVERRLRTVPGVVDVVGFGGPTKQYQVIVDPAKLRAYDVSLADVLAALQAGNRNAGGAYIEQGPQMYVVRGLGLVGDLNDLKAIAVATRHGTPIRVGDLGEVAIGHQLRLGRVGLTVPAPGRAFDAVDEDDIVQGIVLLRKGENALAVLERVREKVAAINRGDLPPGVRIVPHYDRTELIERTLHTVRHNMLEGIALVLVVLVAFLGIGNLRAALVVASTVPLSLLGAFLLLDLRGVPANLISMGAIDFGIIVDSAVVVIERLLRLRDDNDEPRTSLRQLIVEATARMGRPILFSKAILLAAFLPLFTMERVEGRIFHPMALTLAFAILAGTVLAVTAVPVLASFAVRREPAEGEAVLVRWLERAYRPMLEWALRRRAAVIGLALVALAGGGTVLHFLGTEFLPKLDEGALWIHVILPESISPTDAAALAREVRRGLAEFPEVRTIVSQMGRPDDGTDVNGFDQGEVYVSLRPREEWTTARTRDGLVSAMNARLRRIPGVDYLFSQVIEDNVNEAVSGIKGELGIKIFGGDPVTLESLADQVVGVLQGVAGAQDVGRERLSGLPQVQIAIDRAAIARLGLSVADVESVIETAFGGAVATKILEGERTFDAAVKLAPQAVSGVEAIREIPILGPNGERLTLGSVASVEIRPGYANIYREENQRRIAVKLSVRDRDLGSLVAEAQREVDRVVRLPPGYHLEWTGSFENQQRAVRRLAVVVPITLLVIFFLLFSAFDSARLAMLILLNIPFAAIGGIVALPLAGLTLSVSALVGFIAVFGVSVQNGVLLIESIGARRERLPPQAAVHEGALSRMRQVTMTAAMAALGLLPAALSHAVGAETARPFAVVIIGGLVTATALTLFVLPVLYTLFDRAAEGHD
ncbi:efflux RND transporter permease subunit [bacterium]|nr:efflux RND transporter permease subunit [bacterium]